MNFKKLLYCTILLVMSWMQSASAYLCAYQEWYNPQTGQILEEFFDHHACGSRDALLERIKKNRNNLLVIVEDPHSKEFPNSNNGILKNIMYKFCPSFWYIGGYQLSGICNYCIQHGIPVYNMECRSSNFVDLLLKKFDEKYIKEIASYNDCKVLNDFYASLEKYARDIVKQYKHQGECEEMQEYNFVYEALMVDARALHAIYNNRNKHIMLMAGFWHCAEINQHLIKLGWKLRRFVLPVGINNAQRSKIEYSCKVISSFMPVHTKLSGENMPSNAALDIAVIAVDSKILSVPVPDPDRDALLQQEVSYAGKATVQTPRKMFLTELMREYKYSFITGCLGLIAIYLIGDKIELKR